MQQEKNVAEFLLNQKKSLIADIDRTQSRLDYFKSIVNVDLSPDYIAEQDASIRAKLKYLQAYSTLVQRIKSRADGFVN